MTSKPAPGVNWNLRFPGISVRRRLRGDRLDFEFVVCGEAKDKFDDKIQSNRMPLGELSGSKDVKIGRDLSLTENYIGGVDSSGDNARRDSDAKNILAAFFACGRLQRRHQIRFEIN